MTEAPAASLYERDDPLVAASGGVEGLAAVETKVGTILASVGTDRTLRRWDAATGASLGSPVNDAEERVYQVAAWRGPDGPVIAGSTSRGIARWNAVTGLPIGEPFPADSGLITAFTVLPGSPGALLAASHFAGKVERWDVTTGQPLAASDSGGAALFSLVACSGLDEPILASTGYDGSLRRWLARTGEPFGGPIFLNRDRLRRRREYVWSRTLATWDGPGGPELLTSTDGKGTIRRWDAVTGQSIREHRMVHGAMVTALATGVGPDDRPLLFTGGLDGTIRRWDLTTGAAVGGPLTGHTGSVTALVAVPGPQGLVLCSAGDDGTIRRWNPLTGSQQGDPSVGHVTRIRILAGWTSPDGYATLGSVASGSPEIRRWNAAAATPSGDPLATEGYVQAVTLWSGTHGPAVAAGVGAVIRQWDATSGAPSGDALTGHRATVTALATWSGPDGPMLASADARGTILRWNAVSGAPVGKPLLVRRGWSGLRRRVGVDQLAAWVAADGPVLATADSDGLIRRWNATTGSSIGKPLEARGYSHGALITWDSPDGPALGAAVDWGAALLRWNATTGAPIEPPLTGPGGTFKAVATWVGPDGPLLTSAGLDGIIRRWDATTGQAVGEPLIGHRGSVEALTAWVGPDGPLLASGGADGTIRVWDAQTGEPLQRVLVEPIRLRGLADRPASSDVLGRRALTQALSNLLLWRPTEAGGEPGPSVVALEGKWGSGKTTVMRLIRARISARPQPTGKDIPLFGREARRILREVPSSLQPAPDAGDRRYRGTLTAWFNPWAHQSSEQVWAGLGRAIADTARDVLYPSGSPGRSHRYWLTRNAQRIDRFAVRRAMFLHSLSPFLALSAVTGVATVLLNLAKVRTDALFPIGTQRVTLSVIAVAVAVLFLLAGLGHTGWRYYGRASKLLPADLLRGPVLSGAVGEGATEAAARMSDPTYWAKSGYLRLVQEDTAATVRDLEREGYDLVVFIDDLDRCSADTTAGVFEAVNLFLSGTTDLSAKFVIGLDPAVVAAHLDTVHKDLDDVRLLQYGDDPSPGWAFLRKVIQLPVSAPRVTDAAVEAFVSAALAVPEEDVHQATATVGAAPVDDPQDGRSTPPPPGSSLPAASPAGRRAGRGTARTGPLERQPEILALISRRLAAQPDRSMREAKRLLNVWQLHQRVLDLVDPLPDDDAVVERACHLVILAEVTTRWPALQHLLHQDCQGRRGLQLLAAACHDDDQWRCAVKATGLDGTDDRRNRALANLRRLLRDHDGPAVADLAARVM